MKLLDAIRDARLFAHPFGDETWRAWRTFLSALFNETPHTSDLERYREATGRRHWPMQAFTEAWLVIGRREARALRQPARPRTPRRSWPCRRGCDVSEGT